MKRKKSLLFLYVLLCTTHGAHSCVLYRRKVLECSKQAFLACKEICCLIQDMEWLDLKELEEKEKIEMYQKMMDKEFGIKAIAFIFSVSEESIKKLLMKA